MSDLYMDQVLEEQKPQSAPDQEVPKRSSVEADETIQEEQAKDEVTPYTPEELEDIIRNDKPVDFKRLSPEGQAIWKSADRGFKPKLEEAARIRREYDQMLRQLQSQTQAQPRTPKTIEEMFNSDPEGTIRLIRQRIYEEKQKDPFSQTVIQLEQLRDDLSDAQARMIQGQIQQKLIMDEANMAIRAKIPDFESKKDKLNEFALSLGYSPEEISYLTDPRIHGHMAVKTVLSINSLYDKLSSGELKKKEVKEAMKVEKAGSGHEQKEDKEWTYTDYINIRKKSIL